MMDTILKDVIKSYTNHEELEIAVMEMMLKPHPHVASPSQISKGAGCLPPSSQSQPSNEQQKSDKND